MENPSELVELSYDSLNDYFNTNSRETLERDGYWISIMRMNKDFIGFNRMEEPKSACTEGKIFKQYGLKFHISLPENGPKMFRMGWDIVRNTLLRNQVASFKVIRSHLKMSDTPGQEGKDITVYADAEPGRSVAEWKIILEDVTKSLVEGGITPGYRSQGTEEKPEKPIKGSNYITYRYFNEMRKESKWPNSDPCSSIDVNVPGQASIPELIRKKAEEKQDAVKQEFK